MKRFFAGLSAILFIGALVVSCAPKQNQLEGENYTTEKWVDDNTFQVIATGMPKKDATAQVQRRGTAREAAIIMAQKRVVEKFVGARVQGAAGVKDLESTGIAVAKEFSGVVKGGTVKREVYDKDDNCEVTYQVYKKGLKKEVMGGATPQ